ncbi:Lacal_2735 family protein [Zobellia roscoffensis]
MENQYCKVGTVTSIASNRNAISLLEHQYQTFLGKANDMKYADTKLVEFFEQKAEKIQRVLENMMK